MKTATITEARNTLRTLIEGLKAGSPVLIVDRGRPVARLELVTTSTQDGPDGRLSRLLRDGVLRPRRREPAAGYVPQCAAAPSRRYLWGRCADRGAPGRPVTFWDSSAIVPLLVTETMTARLQALVQRDPDMLAWWGSGVECASALARLEREAALDAKGAELAFQRLTQIADVWHEIGPSEQVRENAIRFLRVHPLRAADALQLAAAFVAAERRPASLQVVTLDGRLADAMRKEGFARVDVTTG